MKTPLAEILRPKTLSDFFGQDHILGPKSLISSLIEGGTPLSLLFFGPPGCGKTTLAKIYMRSFHATEFYFHPATHGIAELKKIVKEIQDHPLLTPYPILFVDEIHRLSKAQQDAFLPYIENGTFVLIGATTENPSFAITNALLSRVRVIPLYSLEKGPLQKILERAKSTKRPLLPEVESALISYADGDARQLLNMLENLYSLPSDLEITENNLLDYLQKKPALYDRNGEIHYQLISALHKSVRGSDPDAALYWLARMFEGGEDPNYLARRIVRMATEDIGLADPQALTIALHAWQTYERLGSPEGELALAEAIVYLALAPKSNRLYEAFLLAKQKAKQTSSQMPPAAIVNSPTPLMKELGYGEGYLYDHDLPDGFSGQNYFPIEMSPEEFYHPIERGFEREMKKRKDYFRSLRAKRKKR